MMVARAMLRTESSIVTTAPFSKKGKYFGIRTKKNSYTHNS
jgi:hypothetical protein